MQAFQLSEILAAQAQADSPYLEFLRVPSLSIGLYHLEVGREDKQNPHSEDEVYYVSAGKAKINVAGEIKPVHAGSLIFVPARLPHKFFEIEESLDVLVFFAPAEDSLADEIN